MTGFAARADSLADERGVFSDVRIVGFENGRLVVKFPDDRITERSAAFVDLIALDDGSDMAADELSRAERLFRRKEFAQAGPLYERARGATTAEWVRQFADYRRMKCCDAEGRAKDAVRLFMSLVERHPALIDDSPPTRLPKPDSDAGRTLDRLIDELAAEAVSDTRTRAAQRLKRIMRGAPEPKPPALCRTGNRTAGTGNSRSPDAAAATRSAVPYRERPTVRVHRLLADGQIEDAWSESQRGLKLAAPLDRDMWLLAEAECLLARGEPGKAGLSAMKVTLDADSPYAAEALYMAGRAYETIRRDKARQLYQEAMTHPTTSEALREMGSQRLALLDRAAASQPASGDQTSREPVSGSAAEAGR